MPQTTINQLGIVSMALLDTAVTIIETTSAGAPESQFLTPSRPAFDCEFIAVEVTRLMEGTTSPLSPAMAIGNRNRFGNLIVATFNIYIVRCAPEMNGSKPPTDAAKTASALTVEEDGWALWNGLRDMQDELFDDCLGAFFDGGFPIQEEGAFVGWQFQIRAVIEGYVPT